MGQHFSMLSQSFMQSVWNRWPHFFIWLTPPFPTSSNNPDRHMMHYSFMFLTSFPSLILLNGFSIFLASSCSLASILSINSFRRAENGAASTLQSDLLLNYVMNMILKYQWKAGKHALLSSFWFISQILQLNDNKFGMEEKKLKSSFNFLISF